MSRRCNSSDRLASDEIVLAKIMPIAKDTIISGNFESGSGTNTRTAQPFVNNPDIALPAPADSR